MKKTKLEKGIRLVALIITIVVLLILAVVSIGAVRNSGIIGHATNTTSESTVAEEREIVALAENEWRLQKNTPNNVEDFKTAIETALKNETESGKVKEISKNEDGSLTITFNKTNNKYKITADGKISEVKDELPNEPDDDEKITYADFWEATYKHWSQNKDNSEYWTSYGEASVRYAQISKHVMVHFGDNEDNELTGLAVYLTTEGQWCYMMSMTSVEVEPSEHVQANKWYYATSGSDIDYDTDVGTPEYISTNKSGEATKPEFENLCNLFNEAIGTEGCAPFEISSVDSE